MKSMKQLAAMLAAAALLLACVAPARALETPEQAVGESTMLVAWIDLEQVDNDMIERIVSGLALIAQNPMLAERGVGLPLGGFNEMVESLTTFRKGFVDAGGQGLMMSLEMPAADAESWSPPMSMLAKTSDKVDNRAMSELVRTMSEGKMDAELEPIAGLTGWHDLAVFSAEGESVTMPLPRPDKAAFKAFDRQLGDAKKPLVSVAFRMQESIRQQIAAMAQVAGNDAGQQDPQAAMMIGMLQPLVGIDTLGFAVVSDKDDFEIAIQMVFLKPGDAQQFAQMFNTVMQLAPVMLAGQLQQLDNPPDPNTLNKFFMKLTMQHNGDTLKMKLDREFFDLLEELKPVFNGLVPEEPAIPPAQPEA